MKFRNAVDLAEIVSAIAVVVSLIYLAGQIRQNTEAVQASTAQGLVDSVLAVTAPVLESKETAMALAKAIDESGELNRVESLQWYLFATGVFRNWEARWFSYHRGTMDPRIFESLTRMTWRTINSRPGWASEWERRHGLYDPEFEAFVDFLIESPS